MADPFQDVDSAGPEFIQMFADAMDVRQSDPQMEKIVADYLGTLTFGVDSLTVEVGTGAGAVARRIADHAAPGQVMGYDPSAGFIDEAVKRAGNRANLSFAVADGTALPHDDASVDTVIMHTVLTHVTDPAALITEAARILKPGGSLVACDADFSKASFSNFANDPLDVCAREFVTHFVTDPHLVGKLRSLLAGAGLTLVRFDGATRVTLTAPPMSPWVEATTAQMEERGDIGPELAAGLRAEYTRRAEAGTLYGFQTFATAIARKAG